MQHTRLSGMPYQIAAGDVPRLLLDFSSENERRNRIDLKMKNECKRIFLFRVVRGRAPWSVGERPPRGGAASSPVKGQDKLA